MAVLGKTASGKSIAERLAAHDAKANPADVADKLVRHLRSWSAQDHHDAAEVHLQTSAQHRVDSLDKPDAAANDLRAKATHHMEASRAHVHAAAICDIRGDSDGTIGNMHNDTASKAMPEWKRKGWVGPGGAWATAKRKAKAAGKDEAYARAIYKKLCHKALITRNTNDMMKGKEGSRGGHVIGHTSSGKAVYSHKSGHYASKASMKKRYNNFSEFDHIHAFKLHMKNRGEGSATNDERKVRAANMHHDAWATKKGFDDMDIEKSKEGSRGGHVIGHTRSGKPIYSSSSDKYASKVKMREHYKNFSPSDHKQAYNMHYDNRSLRAGNMHAEQMEETKKGFDDMNEIACPNCDHEISRAYALKSLIMLAKSEGLDIGPALDRIAKGMRVNPIGTKAGDSQIAGKKNGAHCEPTRGGARGLERQRTHKRNRINDGPLKSAPEGKVAHSRGVSKSMFPVNDQPFSLIEYVTGPDVALSARLEAGPIPEPPRRDIPVEPHQGADWDSVSMPIGIS